MFILAMRCIQLQKQPAATSPTTTCRPIWRPTLGTGLRKEIIMTDTIIVALITGGLSLLGVIITSNKTNRDVQAKLDKQQAVTDTKLEELTREVREHNNFARRVPVLEEQIKVANHRIEDLERLSNH